MQNPAAYLENLTVKNQHEQIVDKEMMKKMLADMLCNAKTEMVVKRESLSNMTVIAREWANLEKFSNVFAMNGELNNDNLKHYAVQLDACAMSIVMIATAWSREIMDFVKDTGNSNSSYCINKKNITS